MKVINVSVTEDMYNKLATGECNFDVRIDSNPRLEIGDLVVYNKADSDGITIEDTGMPFLIRKKDKLDDFVRRIGQQMLRKRLGEDIELVIISLDRVNV